MRCCLGRIRLGNDLGWNLVIFFGVPCRETKTSSGLVDAPFTNMTPDPSGSHLSPLDAPSDGDTVLVDWPLWTFTTTLGSSFSRKASLEPSGDHWGMCFSARDLTIHLIFPERTSSSPISKKLCSFERNRSLLPSGDQGCGSPDSPERLYSALFLESIFLVFPEPTV